MKFLKATLVLVFLIIVIDARYHIPNSDEERFGRTIVSCTCTDGRVGFSYPGSCPSNYRQCGYAPFFGPCCSG
uniref:Sodium ion channel toxin n=1 Tax=Exaiptasia diaphana TaxID=2652724 RepID=A0A4Y5RXH5_EXADI|nr:sodium ion channel toxin [Exaiptasia diaphana]